MAMNGAQALVKLLENHGVTHVFGIPGAKIDSVFIVLLGSTIEQVVRRRAQSFGCKGIASPEPKSPVRCCARLCNRPCRTSVKTSSPEPEGSP
jgi:Thiamine pyrophosphate enzyme, N-terminal TPP binding domain